MFLNSNIPLKKLALYETHTRFIGINFRKMTRKLKMIAPSGSSTFSASTVHLEHITTALNCIVPFGGKSLILIYIDADGLSFIGTYNHIIRIQLFLSKELFMSYSYKNDRNDHIKLCVGINQILDSVNIANKNMEDIVECTISHMGEGSPLIFIFEDSWISERVEHSTFLTKEIDNTGFDLDREKVRFECMIKGDVLYTALKDLKEIGCQECYLYAEMEGEGKHTFAIISRSKIGLSKIILPYNKTILEKLEVYDDDFDSLRYNKPVIALFDFNLFDKMRMSIKISSKVLLRLDVHGVLSVNILSQTDDIEFPGSNNSKSTFSSNRPQLPLDYPGIVIELCLMEKENNSESSLSDVTIFMETNEVGDPINPFKEKNIKLDTSRSSGMINPLGLTSGLETEEDDRRMGRLDATQTPLERSGALPRFF